MEILFRGSGAPSAQVGAALVGAALALAGCGGGGTGTGATGTTTGTTTGGTGGGTTDIPCTGQPADLALSGTWAARGQLSVKLQGVPGGPITICPADQVGAAKLLLLITVKQNAADPTKLDQMQATLCSIELPTVTALVGTCDPTSTGLVTTQIIAPQPFLDALPKVATAMATGMLGGKAPGATITVDPLDVVVGSTKTGASLPSWNTTSSACNATSLGSSKTCDQTCVSDCTSLRDDDADGYPGVTIQVCGETSSDTKKGLKCNAAAPSTPGVSLQGQAFIDIEVNPTFTGTVKSSCQVDGTVDSKVLYRVVGADVYLGPGQISVSSAIESLPTFEVDPAASKFTMKRIDGQYGAPDWSVDATQASAACKVVNMRVNEL
jgi:hypothetical protein